MAQDAGKIYVRLVLDDKEYSQHLSDDIRNTEATVKNMARIWSFLGTKTDEYYANQIKGAKNALTYIEESHKHTYNEITRAHSAMVAKINAAKIESADPQKQSWNTLGLSSTAT